MIFESRSAGKVHLPGSERFRLLAECNRLAYNSTVGGRADGLPGIPQLNACLSSGMDLAIFIARISGQIELVCWVDGEHRPWLAGIILQGIGTGLLLPEAGWPEVVAMLELTDAEPVFISCTQGTTWPQLPELREPPLSRREDAGAVLQILPDEWERAEQILRAESKAEDDTAHLADHPTLMAAPFSRQLRPGNWKHYFFAGI